MGTSLLLSACSEKDLSLGTIIPDAPTTLDATGISTTEINLTWNDNADSETGYRIERSLDGIEFEEIQVAAANATSFGDTGLTHSTVYYYRVAATGDYGDSPYTNVASATTGCDGTTSTLCDGRCVDMLTDPLYCGDCDNACGEGRV
ncbi:fibronectin type III domain-containing protein, partial [Myxococcota bacterium]|nr:fibronectin type III domain-containing protein [Myxococcota bacterium]MBU1510177.1 fibronectin type III domain-containing protein [Myxococcota bacterium]